MADNSNGFTIIVYDESKDRRFTLQFDNYYEARKRYWKIHYSKHLIAVSINFDPYK